MVYFIESLFSDKQSQGKGSKSGKSKGKSEKEPAFASSLEDTDENNHFIGRKSFFFYLKAYVRFCRVSGTTFLNTVVIIK